MQKQDSKEEQDSKELLLKYVESNNIAGVESLLNEDPNLSKATYNVFDGQNKLISDGSILYHAAKKGNKEMCQLFLDHGAIATVGRLNPVIFGAVESADKEIVELIVENGASPETRSVSPRVKVADFARQKGFGKIESFLERKIQERKNPVELDGVSCTFDYLSDEDSPLLTASGRPSTTPTKTGLSASERVWNFLRGSRNDQQL